MKRKIICALLAISLVLALMGCTAAEPNPGSSDGTEPSNQPSQTQTQPTQTEASTPDPTVTEPKPTQPQPTVTEPQPTDPTGTTAPTQPSEPQPTVTEPQAGIVFVTWPKTISRNEEGTVTIKGAPNTKYSIKVYYKSGPSTAKGLEDQVSDANGYVTWTWKVGSRTSYGDFEIVVTGGGETAKVNYSVVE